MKKTIFTGSGVAIITPMNADGSVNYDVLGELIEFQIKNGTDAIISCGTTGESATLDHEVHEITHTQVLEHKGIIEDYFNGEVLPIFLELLKVYESGNQNLMDLYDSNRFECLVDYFNCLDDSVIFPGDYTEDTLYKCSMYAESIVKAYSLFIEYVKGSSLAKKYILNGIQDIFDGNLKLEEFLSCFGITFESCFNDQKLLKYFCERKK